MSKTTWRYCVTLTRTEHGHLYQIRELYTGAKGSLSWTAEPAMPEGDTYLELTEDLIRMEQAALTARDVLDITDPEHPEWKPRKFVVAES